MTRKTIRGWHSQILRIVAALGCAAWAVLPAGAQQAPPPFYKVVDLGILPGGTTSNAFAVNADGSKVVGQANIGTKQLPFLWRNGQMELIGDPNTMKSGIARDINGSGTGGKIVGEWVDTLNKKHAFVFDDNAGFHELLRYGTHTNATAWGLNEQGQIAGYSWVDQGIPVRWDSDLLQPTLLYTGARLTYANCTYSGHQFYTTLPIKINEAGHMASTWAMAVTNDCGWPPGYQVASSLVAAAVRYDGATWKVSGGPAIGGCYPYYSNYKFYECADSYGVSINNNQTMVDYGQYRAFAVAGIPMFAMVSYAWMMPTPTTNTYFADRGTFTCQADQNYVKAINDSEIMVGYHLKQDNLGTTCVDNKPYKIESVGWVRQVSGPRVYLMDQIRADCPWKRLLPNDINNAGMIVGAGLHSDGTSHAFMLIPVDNLPATQEEGCVGHGDVPNSNQPPVANAGLDQIVEATSPAGADVTLNGNGSNDPDNDPLTFVWTTPFGPFTVVSPTLTLPLGEHVVTLEVEDSSGLTDTDTVMITVQDTTPPETLITGKPAMASNVASPTFVFEGTDIVSLPADLLFECKLDSGPWTACASPQVYSNLADGSHEFQVRAIDEHGNIDATPASYIWTIDATPPDTTITAMPAAISNVKSPSFAFQGTDNVTPANLLTFQCKLDSGPWTACVSTLAYTNLADGQHQFQVRAADELGNIDPTPAAYSWTLDATPPTIVLNSPAQGASFFLGAAGTASYSCSDSGSGIETCTGTKPNGASITTSTVGSFSFTVNATDLAGNQATVTHDYSVGYGICGYEQFAARKAGSVIPVKLYVCDAAGANLSSPTIAVTATSVIRVSDSANAPLEDAGNANPDFNFRYDGAGRYMFNLDTNGFATGTYWLMFTVSGDPTVHHVEFQIK